MLKRLELSGFKSFEKKTKIDLSSRISAIVGPNGSGKSNVAEALRWVLGEQSLKSLRGKKGEDLIFNGSKTVAKLNRASVSLVFDNTGKRFNLGYDEVTITREVFRDGINRYLVNGSQVRLRDVFEILSAVGIGGSSHHIISQGEADRILNTSGKDRREIIEDALGLKIHQYKKEESAKKLTKTHDNIREVNLLRREVAPHLKYLEKQIEKLEKADALRNELGEKYKEYLAREQKYIASEKDRIMHERGALKDALARIPDVHIENVRARQLELRTKRDDLERKLGRIEGMLSLADRPIVSRPAVIERAGSRVCGYCGQNLPEKPIAQPITPAISERPAIDTEQLSREKKEIEHTIHSIREEEQNLYEQERGVFETREKRNEVMRKLSGLSGEETRIAELERMMKEEIAEGIMHVGRAILEFERILEAVSADEPRMEQDSRKRAIERLKIRLEEAGGTGEDVRKEYEETKKRDEHFAKEVADLEAAAASLATVMDELAVKIAREFTTGIAKINEEFHRFFSLLFDGGEAALVLTKEELPEGETGEAPELIDIAISMPHKKVKGLHMLSGGERALASIALLFAMSQVNPPPFLVLDETDAALDESNSRRYADMIERLSQASQLIVVTHNRETMSRAGVLYGVTMGAEGVSKVLSVKFDEAANQAAR